MPGQPIFRARDIDQLVTDFAVVATRFDRLLPTSFRYDGGAVRKGTRGDAWANCDRQVILLHDALSSLPLVLGLHAKKVKAGHNGEHEDGDDEAEAVVVGNENTPAYADE